MSWVCSYCSSTNAEERTCCEVCGGDRPILSPTEGEKSEVALRVGFFWVYDAIKGSVNRLAQALSALFEKIGSSRKERHVRRTVKRTKVTRRKAARVKPAKRTKVSHVRYDFAEPWPEHRVKFDADAIKSKGFVRSERAELNSVKGYMFYREDGTHQFIRAEMLIAIRIATAV